MNIKKIVMASVVTVGLSMTAQANELSAGDSSIATDLCMVAASGNRAAMYSKVKESGHSFKFVAKNITCNGDNILAFVEQYGKRSQKMLNILDRSSHAVSITDIAQNSLTEK